MSSASVIGSGFGKLGEKASEGEVTLKDVVMLLAAIKDIVRPLQPLHEQVP
jgi:hypothetical protein